MVSPKLRKNVPQAINNASSKVCIERREEWCMRQEKNAIFCFHEMPLSSGDAFICFKQVEDDALKQNTGNCDGTLALIKRHRDSTPHKKRGRH